MPIAAEETENAEDLYEQIQASQDKLFFIQYGVDQTFNPNWYIVRISAEQRDTAPSWICTTYTIDVYTKHPNDVDISDPDSRWWPEWHEHVIVTYGIPELGRHVVLKH
jgi:hypothetical protein